ncbi:telomerase reverse transcriptase-like [Amphiura filiformis]|uniref:telomerase reverse transcriptase-like n=1 Tax=Amphiura filiformis TaxID=82378 RepID=UPI003B21DF78
MNVLKAVYHRTSSLQDYLKTLPPGCSEVLQDGDKPGYKSFLRNTVVGIPSSAEALQQPINYQQLSDQAEVVIRVIKKLSRQPKNAKNVLLFGWQATPYRLWTTPRVPGASDTGHFLPGNTGNQLKTPNWKRLLSRIGDEVMMHLLGDLSVFVKAPPSCFIQLTGTPVYDIVASVTTTVAQSAKDTTVRHGVNCDPLQHTHVAVSRRGKKRKRSLCEGDHDSDVPAKRIHQDTLCCSSVPSTQSEMPCHQSTAKPQQTGPAGIANVCKHETKKKTKVKQDGTSGNRQNVDSLKPATNKMFYAVDMCYNLGGRQNMPKSHPIEAVPTNAPGARQLTGLIFNVTYINKGYQQAQGINQTKQDSSKNGTQCIQGSFTALKAKKVSMQGKEEKEVPLHSIDSKPQKAKQKPQLTPRRYIKVQKLLHAMIKQHRKTSIYHLLKFHCPVDTKLSILNSKSHQHQQTLNSKGNQQQQIINRKCNQYQQSINSKGHQQQQSNQTIVNRNELKVQDILKLASGDGSNGPVVCCRRSPTCDNQVDDSMDTNQSAIPTENRNATQSEEIDLISMATPSHQIYLFIRSVLVRVVPPELWGSLYNRAVFFKFVKQYLYLGRFEKLSLQQLFNDMQLSDCDWTHLETMSSRSPTDLAKQHQMLAGFFAWLMDSYVITLVKTMFYVTESSCSKSQLLFFHKPIWHKLERIGAKKLQAAGVIQPITEQVAMDTMKSAKSLGCSKLRFVPKKRSLRPIVRMGKSSIPNKETLSINVLLQGLFDVLTHIKHSNPASFGSAVLGTDTIYPKWRHFVQAHKEHHINDSTQLYFIKLDIEKCYESIQHDKLFQVITTLLNSEPSIKEYVIRRYATVTLHQGHQRQRAFQRHVSTSQEVVTDFHRVLMGLAKDNQCVKNAVIVNQVSQHIETPSSLITRLKQHVKHDILKSGGQHYLRTSGICQGSAISSLLCSFFYAHMEKCCLSGIEEDGLLLHLVDDFLLVTPHLNKAHRFLRVLLKGLPQYGCNANPDKTLVNFDYDYEGTCLPRIPAEGLFPWCGLLFHTVDLHVYNEYARYHGIMIRYTLTMDTTGDVFSAMKSKLKKSLQAKDICIFVDPHINSTQAIITNSYQMLLMLAFRFHAYYHNLPSSCKTSQLPHNKLMGFILHLCDYFHQLINNKLASHNALPEEESFPLTKTSVKWLCLKAFDTKLSKHQTTYSGLLKMIGKHRRKIALVLGRIKVADLQACCTPNEDFTKML